MVVPFFDEADQVAAVVDELVGVLEGELGSRAGGWEVVLVDDGSRDGTAAELAAAAARHPGRVRAVGHAGNRGKSAALLSGAAAARAPWLGTIDGDGQNDPRDLVRLYRRAVAEAGAEGAAGSSGSSEPIAPVIVAGCRRRRADTVVKRLSSRVANAVRSRLLADASPDTGCGLKVLPRELFLDLPRFRGMHRFLPALVIQRGGRAVSETVDDRPRAGGHSKYGTGDRLGRGLADLVGVLWLARRGIDLPGTTPIRPPSAAERPSPPDAAPRVEAAVDG